MGSKLSRIAAPFSRRRTNSHDSHTESAEYHGPKCTCDIEPGSIEYYNLVARQYGRSPDEIARAVWMKALIEENTKWVSFDHMGTNGSGIKAFDYCAGKGFLSQALAPHFNNILAMDNSQNMTIQYNKRAEETQEAHTHCEMRAVLGDLVYGKVPLAEFPDSVLPFDLVAMCLAVDFFAPNDASDDDAPGLIRALGSLTSRLKDNGTLLILDIEKDHISDSAEEAKSQDYQEKSEQNRNGKKVVGYGSNEIRTALDVLGMTDVDVKGDLWFEEPSDGGQVYFLLKARKVDACRENVVEI
ncbi:hypothetical protein IMSHALPRED_002855 [Imshaugia aleurites]|uniref:Methyltransferase domain-containing protein n=1 Tax=Imshaugia aleurites TaxID=172621 RepID=A0A8H3J6L4_9LECA|nr:hypothetical protein IMSHALPRED_002855 [Imshaugia aleurites]